MEKNYYEILGINTDATSAEIKSAFRKLARIWHPDVAGGTSEAVAKFKEINEAYEVLSNPEKRKKYDTFRGIFNNVSNKAKENSKSQKQENKSKSEAHSKEEKQTEPQKKQQKNQQQESSTNRFQEAWETFIKKTQSKEAPKQKKYQEKKIDGSDITSEILITVSESLMGTTRMVNVLHTQPCPKCKNRKFVNGAICPQCHGAGEISMHKKISVKIPEHVKQGAKIRISGEGNPGVNGGKNGDLYLIVKIDTNSSGFEIDGLNVLQTVRIAPYEAVLGEHVSIKTYDGKTATVKLMAGTKNGQKYRLANQGIKKDDKVGDMIITVIIDIAKNLSKEEVLLYKKLKEVATSNIRDEVYGE